MLFVTIMVMHVINVINSYSPEAADAVVYTVVYCGQRNTETWDAERQTNHMTTRGEAFQPWHPRLDWSAVLIAPMEMYLFNCI